MRVSGPALMLVEVKELVLLMLAKIEVNKVTNVIRDQ